MSNETVCEFGCIFHEGKLHGDCRMPESPKCEMNIRKSGTIDGKDNSGV